MRDGIRPQMPATPGLCPLEFAELITSCWHADPTVRPTFLEIMTRLPAMHTGADLTSGVTTSLTSKTSTISPFSSVPPGEPRQLPRRLVEPPIDQRLIVGVGVERVKGLGIGADGHGR
jgi:hypothetical protein